MFSRTAIEDQALRVVLEERIRALWGYRAWYREHRWAEWPLRRRETDIELRALVRLAREARRMSKPLVTEPYTPAETASDLLSVTVSRPLPGWYDGTNAGAARWPDAPESELRALAGDR